LTAFDNCPAGRLAMMTSRPDREQYFPLDRRRITLARP